MARRGRRVGGKSKRKPRKRLTSRHKTPQKSPPRRRKKSPPPKPKKSPPRRRKKFLPPKTSSLPWVGKPVLGPFDRPLAQEAEFASAYCRKWLATYNWATDTVIGDVTLRNGDPRRRIAEGLLVRDTDDSEEAAERGIKLERLGRLPDGPGKESGGARRVTIRLLTWLWDVRQQDAYQPQWGTFGTGLTALQATRQFNRYIHDYENAVSKGIESRRLIVTGMSIVWWTSDPKELNYV